ncbi:MAG: hypothetical protein U0166_13515 [Acidobacteriota bacterium]
MSSTSNLRSGDLGRSTSLPIVTLLLGSIAIAMPPCENGPVSKEAAAFAAECSRRGAEGSGPAVAGKEGWLFFRGDLHHLGAGPYSGPGKEATDPLPAIVDFAEGLRRAGIELLIVPIPSKPSLFPEMLGIARPSSGRLDLEDERFACLLAQRGVQVVDPFTLLAADPGKMFLRTDAHYSGLACQAIGKLVADEIKKRAWVAAVARTPLASEERTIEIEGDLARAATPGAKEKVPLRVVGKRGPAGIEPVAPDAASPVVLLGDSHALVFHSGGDLFATGAGLADQLALELGFPVDLMATRGSASTKVRVDFYRKAKEPGYLAGKKIVVWCFAAREFTEGDGWRKVPVAAAP